MYHKCNTNVYCGGVAHVGWATNSGRYTYISCVAYAYYTVCCRAFNTLGCVMRTLKKFKLSRSFKTIYCSPVWSLLEYASVLSLWDSFAVVDSYYL